MQAFRLMGMPDKLIAFEELPERFVQGLEMKGPDGLPRHWKDWLGKKQRVIRISPERDPITGQVRTFQPIIEEGPFFYLIDWTLNRDQERWDEICDFVRRNAPKEFRLKDKIEDMAISMAPDVRAELNIEPEQVPIIPIPEDAREKTPIILTSQGGELRKSVEPRPIIESAADLKALRHGEDCKTKGRGKFTDGCPRCEMLKSRNATVAA